jgi:hypothetical protein
MDHDLICSWLGLPPGTWPPDHYRLLGLEAGEDNAELIEHRVHERLDTVRCYQMMHPDLATEAMNRLAQAFVCLTDPAAKKSYDAQLGIAPPAVRVSAVETPAPPPTPPTPIEWLPSPELNAPAHVPMLTATVAKDRTPAAVPAAPPPLPVVVDSGPVTPSRQPPPLPPIVEATETPAAPPEAIPIAPPLTSAPPLEPGDPFLEVVQAGSARRGIGTKRGLYQRIALTRQLLRVWNALGKYLSSSKRRLSRSVDGPDLTRLLDEVVHLLRRFPPLLGEAGQPGYLVLALTAVDTIKVFQSFSPHQREALSRDWGAGVKLLTAYRDFLRQELRARRKRPLGQRLVRASWSLLIDQPGTVLLLLALLAVNVALWRTYAEELWERFFGR